MELRRFQTEVEETLEKAQGGDVAVMVVDIGSRTSTTPSATLRRPPDPELDQLSSHEGKASSTRISGPTSSGAAALEGWRTSPPASPGSTPT
ncbi:MAG: hypothetical protein ACLSVD_08770 [Eggerthellaceae bacterium]